VMKNAPLVQIDSVEAQTNLVSAQARIAQARSEIEVINKGGRATDLAEISSGLERARHDLEVAQKEYESAERLKEKGAVPALEVTLAKQKVDQAKLAIKTFEQRKQALAVSSDRAAAQARLEEAQAAASLAQDQIRQSVVRAPIEGTVYQFDLKPGAYLTA